MKGYGKYIICKKGKVNMPPGHIVLPDSSDGLQWLDVVSVGCEADVKGPEYEAGRILASVSKRTIRHEDYYIIHNDEVVAYE